LGKLPQGRLDKTLSRWAVRMEDENNNWFEIMTGVRQSCFRFLLLVLIVIDWVVRKVTSEGNLELSYSWDSHSVLSDLGSASDVAVLRKSVAETTRTRKTS